MAEIRTQHEPALPAKRKPDPSYDNKAGGEEAEEHPNKSQKLDDSHTLESYKNNKSNEEEDGVVEGGDGEEKEKENGEEKEKEKKNGEAVVVDRKGKGIMVNEDEGSQDEEEDDKSSDDDDESEFDGDDDDCSELEEDPLAEVDLDNILPSRTRRRVVHPGEYIADDLGDDDDDDSDDSAA